MRIFTGKMLMLKIALVLVLVRNAKSDIFKAIQGCEKDYKFLKNVTSTSVVSSDVTCVMECYKSSVCLSVNVCPSVQYSNLYSCEQMEEKNDWSCGELLSVPGCSFYQKVGPWCYNGGTYDETSESCDCVFGFTGDWCERYYYDCSEAFQKTLVDRGVQPLMIQPRTSPQPFIVTCYLEWGGYTYIMRQQGYCAQLDFNQNWEEMKQPFGDPGCNFWVGLENIHQLTSQATYLLDIFMVAGGFSGHPLYTEFSLGDEASGYEFRYTDYHPHSVAAEDGFGADGVNGPKGHSFATYDRPDPGNCVAGQGVSWWYGPACPEYNPHLPLDDGGAGPYLTWPEGGSNVKPSIFVAQIQTTW